MKKLNYAILGGVMIIAAALIRSLSSGGSELVLGLVLLIASVDVPDSRKGSAR